MQYPSWSNYLRNAERSIDWNMLKTSKMIILDNESNMCQRNKQENAILSDSKIRLRMSKYESAQSAF